jgi:hypothetical protein
MTFEYAPAPESRASVSIKPKYGHYIGGKFVAGEKHFPTINPATEEVLSSIALGSKKDVDAAVKAAKKALDVHWSKLSGRERGKYLFRIARILQERTREFAVLESLDNGKPYGIAYAATPTLTATATPSTPVCAGDTVQLNSSAVIPFTYVQSTETFFLETLPATAGPSGDDVVSAALPLGFGFNYYGVNYTQFAISTNGNIQLGNGSGTANNPAYNNQWTDAAIPNAAVPNNMIALAWDDWDITAGQIRYGVTGVSPNQKMVVSFVTTGRGFGGADTLDGQIVLEETTNKIYMNIVLYPKNFK